MNSRLWKILMLSIPVTGILRADEFDVLKARYAADQNMYRRDMIVAEANAPTIITGATTQTVVTARDAKLADREAKYLSVLARNGFTLATDIDAAADGFYAAVTNKAGRLVDNNAQPALADGQYITTLRSRIIELQGDPKTATGRTQETNTVITPIKTSPAMQRLGRPATAEDLR